MTNGANGTNGADGADGHESGIETMLRTIDAETRQTAFLTGRKALSKRVLAAMREVPRHLFVPREERDRAYANAALPIGHGQTISQPFVVALMTDLLRPAPEQTVLEVGTGSGYQTAILARLAGRVISLESNPFLAGEAERRLGDLGVTNVEIHQADGYYGWQEGAPYPGIMVTAAVPAMPPELLAQLAPGGRLVVPVGHPRPPQDLELVERDAAGRTSTHSILPVSFVPMSGQHGEGSRGMGRE